MKTGSLKRDPELCRRLGAGGRRTAEQLYSWDVIGKRTVAMYFELLGASEGAAPEGARSSAAPGR